MLSLGFILSSSSLSLQDYHLLYLHLAKNRFIRPNVTRTTFPENAFIRIPYLEAGELH